MQIITNGTLSTWWELCHLRPNHFKMVDILVPHFNFRSGNVWPFHKYVIHIYPSDRHHREVLQPFQKSRRCATNSTISAKWYINTKKFESLGHETINVIKKLSMLWIHHFILVQLPFTLNPDGTQFLFPLNFSPFFNLLIVDWTVLTKKQSTKPTGARTHSQAEDCLKRKQTDQALTPTETNFLLFFFSQVT